MVVPKNGTGNSTIKKLLKNLKNILEIVVGDASEVAKETTNLILLDNNFQNDYLGHRIRQTGF